MSFFEDVKIIDFLMSHDMSLLAESFTSVPSILLQMSEKWINIWMHNLNDSQVSFNKWNIYLFPIIQSWQLHGLWNCWSHMFVYLRLMAVMDIKFGILILFYNGIIFWYICNQSGARDCCYLAIIYEQINSNHFNVPMESSNMG